MPAPPNERRTLPVAALLFLSGAAALVDEVTWVRLLTLLLGAGAPAVGAVLAVFFLGLAGGARLAARAAARARSPLLAYAALEAGIGLFAAASPTLFGAAESLYLRLGAGHLFARLLVASLLLLPPTIAMGATLPFALRACASESGGSRAGSLLYAANTAGGVAGCLLAGFVLLEALGLRGTLLVSAGASLAAGAGAFALRSRAPAQPAPAAPIPTGERVPLPPLVLAAGAGFLAVAAEVLFTRLLGRVLGGTVYAFAAMLACFLAGIAAGAALLGAIPVRRPRAWVAAFSVAAAILLAASPRLLRTLAAAFAAGDAQAIDLEQAMLRSFLACALVLLPTGMLSGAVFALLLRIATGERASPAEATGRLYAWNTVGSVAGSIVGTWFLLRSAGTGLGLGLVAAGHAALGAAAVAERGARAATRLIPFPLVAGLAVFVASREDLRGLRLALAVADEARYGHERPPERVLHMEGPSASVAVYDEASGRTLRVNGKVVASTAFIDARNQLLLGHLPALLHPAPKEGLVVGLGTGMTAGALAVHPGIRVQIVELAPEVRYAAAAFARWNHDLLGRENARVVIDDGRHFLLATDRTFDVVTSDPMHPWVAGGANLYSLDYFRLVRRRLAPGGIAAQWLPLYEMRLEEARSIVATFAAAFDHCALWIAFQDAILLGSDAPLLPDLAALATRTREAEILDDLASIDLDEPDRLASLLVALDAEVRALAADAPLVTDDRQTLEFRAARSQVALTVGRNIAALSEPREATLRRLLEAFPDPARAALFARTYRGTGAVFRAYASLAEGLQREGRDAILDSWVQDPDGPRVPWGKALPSLAQAFAAGSDPASAYGRGVILWQEAKELVRSRDAGAREKLELAAQAFAEARAATGPLAVAARRERAKVLGEQGRFDECLAEVDAAISIDPGLPVLHRTRALALLGANRADDALAALDRAAALDGGAAPTWSLRGTVLAARGDLDGAAAAFREALARNPRDARARAFLARRP